MAENEYPDGWPTEAIAKIEELEELVDDKANRAVKAWKLFRAEELKSGSTFKGAPDMAPSMPEERIRVSGAVREAGQTLYESIEDGPLKWIVGDLLEGNCRWAVDHPGTYGEGTLLRVGFTDNQRKWIPEMQAIVARATRADRLEKALREILEESRCWGWDFNPDNLEKIALGALGDAAPEGGEGDE